MATTRITDYQFIQELEKYNKPYFSIADFEKIFNRSRSSLRVTLHRLVRRGALKRLTKGVYQTKEQVGQLQQTANQLYFPSYLSFESALAYHGILSQQPYTLTFATTKRSKKLQLESQEVQYRQLDEEYYFGYFQTSLGLVAHPEKAVLDQLYFIDRGLSFSQVDEWSLVGINQERLSDYASAFPSSVQKRISDLLTLLGSYHVSSQDRVRVKKDSKA